MKDLQNKNLVILDLRKVFDKIRKCDFFQQS